MESNLNQVCIETDISNLVWLRTSQPNKIEPNIPQSQNVNPTLKTNAIMILPKPVSRIFMHASKTAPKDMSTMSLSKNAENIKINAKIL